MVLRLLAERLSGEDDIQAAPVRVRRLRENGDPRVLRHERGQGHAAEPRLVGLQDRRTAGERCGGDEDDQENAASGASSLAPPRREAPLLGAIAADLHFAPPPAVVLAAIIEQPAASVAAAFPDAVKIAFREQPDRRERDRTQRRLDRRSAHAPRPAARQDARRELRLGDTSRVKSGKAGERRFGRLGATPERRADIVDRRREARSPAPGDPRRDPRARPRASAASRPLRRATPSRASAIRRRSQPRESGSDARESRGRIWCWRSRARDRRRSGQRASARGEVGRYNRHLCLYKLWHAG